MTPAGREQIRALAAAFPRFKVRLVGLQTALNNRAFGTSARYWERRYRHGGSSGDGSLGELASYKAAFLNRFVSTHDVHSVIEIGCGDGNQLSLAKYPRYLGIDVSYEAIRRCVHRFSHDTSKSFIAVHPEGLYDRAQFLRCDLSVSLDVIYHLVEDDIYRAYMKSLFGAAERYVVIYSSNTEDNSTISSRHIRNRQFTNWIAQEIPGWRLREEIPNPYSLQARRRAQSIANFFVYELAQ